MDRVQAVQRGRPNTFLGTEHLLLGLLAQQGIVQGVFAGLSLEFGLAQWKTNDAMRRNDRSPAVRPPRPKYLTPCAKRALKLANEETDGGPQGSSR